MTQTEEAIDASSAAQTGAGPTTVVAIEQYFPAEQRIIHDDLALRILPASYRFFSRLTRISVIRNWMVRATEKRARGLWSGIMCRKRYIDDRVVSDVRAENSVKAVVNLGAGYDTRAYRLPALATVPVWEVDQPGTIKAKQANVIKALGKFPHHITLVSIDFNREKLEPLLASQGYPADTKTFFIWEAVCQYLSETGVRQIFDFLAQAPTGSRLVFTYIRKDFIDGSNRYGQEVLYQQMIVKDTVWHFGFDPKKVTDFLSEYGWRIIEHLGYDELAELYVKPIGRELPTMAIERMVYAEKV